MAAHVNPSLTYILVALSDSIHISRKLMTLVFQFLSLYFSILLVHHIFSHVVFVCDERCQNLGDIWIIQYLLMG